MDELCVALIGDSPNKEKIVLDWQDKLSQLNLKGIVKIVPYSDDWGKSLEESKKQIREPWTLLAPIQSDPEILTWIEKHSKEISDLDGVTFRRKGTRFPWFLRGLSLVLYQPFRFLLEMPLVNGDSWLGWSNWKWELQGYWLFGVRNHDPLNPIRLLRTDWFAQIPLQSKTNWGNLEMLAKAHFLGARLAEEICPTQTKVENPSGKPWKDLTQLIQKPRFTPFPIVASPLPFQGNCSE